jgi:hypothetical protein
MGWLFGHATRKSLVNHLLNTNGLKTIKSCSVGTHLWAVQEGKTQNGETIVLAILYLIQGPPFGRDTGDPYAWGYKDVDETMGPTRCDFPASWLELLSPTTSQWALEWRARARERGDKIKSMTIGSCWKASNGHTYELIKRRSPTSFLVRDTADPRVTSYLWKTSLSVLMNSQRVEPERLEPHQKTLARLTEIHAKQTDAVSVHQLSPNATFE